MKSVQIGDRVIDQDSLRLTPRLCEPAPDFEVQTTHGPRKLSDYRGKWLVLFSHPADFTPICTSEIVAFARAYEKFKALNCELLALSLDSLYSHLAWIKNIREKFGVDIPFPIASDVSMWVACVYGMIQPGASAECTVRACFLIDPEGRLRSMLYYPIGVGRSVSELLRMVAAAQVSDQHQAGTPEGWQPGDPVVLPAPRTAEEAAQRQREGAELVDWYYTRKPL
jgi:peroxiredoxin (alkyl hydroperoxide reductase subunit C)